MTRLVKDCLPLDVIAHLTSTRPAGAPDALEMQVAACVDMWRTVQIKGNVSKWEGVNADAIVAHNWLGGVVSRLGLPKDEHGMWALPGPDWICGMEQDALNALSTSGDPVTAPLLSMIARLREENAAKSVTAEYLTDPLALAVLFHVTYEKLAPGTGYETRKETRIFDPESANGKLMVRTCAEIQKFIKEDLKAAEGR